VPSPAKQISGKTIPNQQQLQIEAENVEATTKKFRRLKAEQTKREVETETEAKGEKVSAGSPLRFEAH